MTTEEKAKVYDEALERAKQYLGAAYPIADANLVKEIFPELVDSKNERIKKSLINYINAHGNGGDFTKEEYIAWLEKQKPIIAKFRVGDVITSLKNNDLKYLIKEVGVKNELGTYDYVVEDVSDTSYKGRTHKMSIEKVDNWGVPIDWIKDYGTRSKKEWSEDEKIRKELLKHCTNAVNGVTMCVSTADYARWLAWLEKQGKQKNTKHSFLQDAFDKSKRYTLDEKKEASEYSESILPTSIEYGESEEEYKLHTIMEAAFIAGQRKLKQTYYGSSIYCRQGEHKSADKVEPKFHEGDWIYHETSGNTFHINKIENDLYVSDEGATISLGRQNNWRLWTIQDAKDGDVLMDGDNVIRIFNGIEGLCFRSKFYYSNFTKKFYGIECVGFHKFAKPATKEQRDLLFQKMKEAGYEWDADKKELKKIEDTPLVIDEGKDEMDRCFTEMVSEYYTKQKPDCSEKDEKIRKALIRHFKELAEKGHSDLIFPPEGVVAWLERQGDQKPEWSEDDIIKLKSTIAFLRNPNVIENNKELRDKTIDWLKSLKDRYTWKPSEEQIEAVKCAALDVAKFSQRSEQLRLENDSYYKALISLYEQLKKLREE